MEIIIYSTPICSRCKTLKAACQEAEVFYQEYPLDSRAISDCLCETGEHVTSAPLVRNGAVYYFVDDIFTSMDLKSNWLAILAGIKPEVKQFTGHAVNAEKVQSCKSIWRD